MVENKEIKSRVNKTAKQQRRTKQKLKRTQNTKTKKKRKTKYEDA